MQGCRVGSAMRVGIGGRLGRGLAPRDHLPRRGTLPSVAVAQQKVRLARRGTLPSLSAHLMRARCRPPPPLLLQTSAATCLAARWSLRQVKIGKHCRTSWPPLETAAACGGQEVRVGEAVGMRPRSRVARRGTLPSVSPLPEPTLRWYLKGPLLLLRASPCRPHWRRSSSKERSAFRKGRRGGSANSMPFALEKRRGPWLNSQSLHTAPLGRRGSPCLFSVRRAAAQQAQRQQRRAEQPKQSLVARRGTLPSLSRAMRRLCRI